MTRCANEGLKCQDENKSAVERLIFKFNYEAPFGEKSFEGCGFISLEEKDSFTSSNMKMSFMHENCIQNRLEGPIGDSFVSLYEQALGTQWSGRFFIPGECEREIEHCWNVHNEERPKNDFIKLDDFWEGVIERETRVFIRSSHSDRMN